MKASVHHRYGPPDVLALEEIDKPVLGDDDVLIRGHAAGLNLADDVVMKGVPYIARLFAGLRQPKHGVRGIDLTGTVTEVGWKVTDLRPGDEVFGSCANLYVAGAFAEYARAPRDKVVPKPATITFEQAAAVPIAACAALKALRDAAHVQPGQKVLINGASGGVGTFAVQIAKALGAQVTGVCSTRNTDLVRSIGADAVIDYTQEDFTQGTERFDVLLDNVANHPLSHCRRALTPKGTLIPNANTSGRWLGGLSQILRLGRENPRWGYLTPSRCSGSPRFPTQPSWWKEGTRPCTSWSTSLGPGSLTSCPDLRCATRSYAWYSPTPGASRRTGRTGFCLRHSLTPKDHPNSDRTDPFTIRDADAVITMGCGDACPIYPGKRYLDWDLPEPAGKTVEEIRPIRAEIDRLVRGLLEELSSSASGGQEFNAQKTTMRAIVRHRYGPPDVPLDDLFQYPHSEGETP